MANGNGTNYVDGLKLEMYKNPTQSNFDNILNATGGGKYDTEEQFLSSIYNYKADVDQFTSPVLKAPFSIGNRYALFAYTGLHVPYTDANLTNYYKLMANNNIHGGEKAKEPSVNNIIEFFNPDTYGAIEYDFSDFLWGKYFKKVQNNQLITLRRFMQPCEDNIYNVIRKTFDPDTNFKKTVTTDKTTGATTTTTTSTNKGKVETVTSTVPKGSKTMSVGVEPVKPDIDVTQPDIARAVAWFGEGTPNSLDELLTFTYGYTWTEQTSETNSMQSNDQGYTAHPAYEGMNTGGQTFVDSLKGVTAGAKYQRLLGQGYDPLLGSYPNFVVGPVNVVNKMTTRGVGLNFDQTIKVVFEYRMCSYYGIDPKIAMMDIMANLLVLTYDNAAFWGGANRFYGAAGFVAKRFGNDKLLRQGDFKGYLGSLVTDVSVGLKNVFGDASGEITTESGIAGLLKLGSNFLGNMMGKLINSQLGAPPAYQQLKGMITGEATGNWHLTVGNPMNPIVMIGNLILESSTLSFNGNLGYNDFPEFIKLECELKHARPRDKTDFESMFNAGKGRIYVSSSEFADILNLQGKDVNVYGAFQTSLKNEKTGGSTSKFSPENFEQMAKTMGADAQTQKRVGKIAYWMQRSSVTAMSAIDAHQHY